MTIRVATWNVNSLKVRLPQVLDFLKNTKVDALCLQEIKMQDTNVPVSDIEAAGYRIYSHGQKTYNGVATLVKASIPFSSIQRNIPEYDDEQSRVIAGSLLIGDRSIRLVNGYFPNGESTSSPKFLYKQDWLKQLESWIAFELTQNANMVIVGDFNIAPEDRDVWNPDSWKDSVLCVPEVRKAFQSLLNLGFVDSFRLFEQPEKSFSWWDYRMMAFRRNHGLRIDHILVSHSLAPSVHSVVIDKEPRKLEKPSDHTPVIAEIA